LLDYDIFENLDFEEFLQSKFIKQERISIADAKLIKEIMAANRAKQAQAKFEELKEHFKNEKMAAVSTEDFQITNKWEADCALYMKLQRVELPFDLSKFDTTPKGEKELQEKYQELNQLKIIEKGTEDFKAITPSEAQRFYVYIEVLAPDKDAVLQRLKQVFPTINITQELVNTPHRVRRKLKIFEMLVEKYKALKQQSN